MKKIKNILVAAVVVASMVRCGNFLDVESYVRDMQKYDSIFVRENTTKEWLWEVYSSLEQTPSISNGALYFASDEAVYNDATASCELYQNGQYSSSNQIWEDRYKPRKVPRYSSITCTAVWRSPRPSGNAWRGRPASCAPISILR